MSRVTKTDAPESIDMRFLRLAKLCRARDLGQLALLGELVRTLSELVHALQKERGASSIFLGSLGAQFAARRLALLADSAALERAVHEKFEQVDDAFAQLGNGARFYTAVARALRALELMPELRTRIAALAVSTAEAVKTYTQVIAALLGVGFEAADVAADPDTSRALVALVNFTQGKEYAGQERAVAGAAFSRGCFEEPDRRHLMQLVAAQARAFQVFIEFADARRISAYQALSDDAEQGELMLLRRIAHDPGSAVPASLADEWYAVTTRRIDAMKSIEDDLAADLKGLCEEKLLAAQSPGADELERSPHRSTGPLSMMVADVDTASEMGAALYTMRSVLDVVGAQSRRIDDMNLQLEQARVALLERKVIEQAKGLLMRARKMSERDAYTLLRQTAMNEHKRLYEIAAAVVAAVKG